MLTAIIVFFAALVASASVAMVMQSFANDRADDRNEIAMKHNKLLLRVSVLETRNLVAAQNRASVVHAPKFLKTFGFARPVDKGGPLGL